MMSSLYTASSGMNAQQFNINNISHNLSNVNTTGYKKLRSEFEDLLYQTHTLAGTPVSESTTVPTGVQKGLGVKVVATKRDFSTGSLKATQQPTDMAINGTGFFKVQLPDGSLAYTRDGSMKVDANGQVVTSNGHIFQPDNPIFVPEGNTVQNVSINEQGRVQIRLNDSTMADIGQVNLHRFVNPEGLEGIGQNLFKVTPASGEAQEGTPNLNGFGQIRHKFLEMANVNLADEMVNMIVAQRAYETNSKAIQTSDRMLGTAVSLKR
jgi:flagellar basal-body rod protein FlgG